MTDTFLHFEERYRHNIHGLNNNPGETSSHFTDRFIGVFHGLLRLNRDIDHTLSEFDVARHRFTAKGAPPEPEKSANKFVEARRYMIYNLIAPAYESLVRKTVYFATHIDQARLACALERYRLAHGTYPAQLEALMPEFIKSIPPDVFDGQPPHYRPSGDKFLLYSNGPDLKDDQGKSTEFLDESPDWVWGESYE